MKNIFSLIAFLFIFNFVNAQPIPKIGIGHQSKIVSLGMSENGKYGISLSDKGVAVIWDLQLDSLYLYQKLQFVLLRLQNFNY